MSNLIDRLASYLDGKNETFGEWYTRCLCALLWLATGVGYVTGLVAGFLWGLRL